MLKLMTLLTAAAVALAMPVFAADPDTNSAKPVLDQLREESRLAKKNATELATMLKSKNADLAKAAEQVTAVEKSHETIMELMSRLEAEAAQWGGTRKANFEQARKVADVMSVFVDNKKSIAQDGISPSDREALRLHATGVAQRAELLEKTLSKL